MSSRANSCIVNIKLPEDDETNGCGEWCWWGAHVRLSAETPHKGSTGEGGFTYKYTKNTCSLSLPDRSGLLGLSSAEAMEARDPAVVETSTRWYRRNKAWLEVLSNS